jgi:membrane protein DedA with SNARE-associated domain
MLDGMQRIIDVGPTGFAEMPAVSIAAALFFLTFVSEDAACLAAGTLARQGRLGLAAAVLACFAGILVGDVGLYGLGRLTAAGFVKNRRLARWFSGRSVARAGRWLEQQGASAVLISRFITGLRLPTYLAAGLLRTRFVVFLSYFVLAAALWTPIAVGVSYASSGLFAESLFAAMLASFLLIRVAIRLATRENRRSLVGRWKRFAKWEFWPMPVFYLPVVIYCLLLAVRYRSLTVFTCANPAIAGGGLAGESKDTIFGLIERSGAAGASMLRHLRMDADVPSASRLDLAREFVEHNRLSFPIVLKPDVGERGRGVTVARDWREVENYVSAADGDTILQEHFEGVEASVFYYRFPQEARGRIFSITQKEFPTVTGDGVSDLRTLVLDDPRAVALAESYFRENEGRLYMVPGKGETVRLLDIGTHSRGAIFLDGEWMRSGKLEQAIDEICRGIEGFHFGRFDLRAGTFEDFKNGGPFRIIELNGVASESTNIYDPRFSLFDAYRTLFSQWRLAFAIGGANAALGAEPTPLLTLIGLVLNVGTRKTGGGTGTGG